MQASATAEDDAAQAQGLAVQAQMMRMINRCRRPTPTANRAGGGASAVPAHVPPPHAAAPLRVPRQKPD